MNFSVKEASAFARALAGAEGIHVEESHVPVVPTSTIDGTIIMSEPSIYDSEDYMGLLHKEISKQVGEMKFFMEVEDPISDVLQGMRTEYNMLGDYQGRDRILKKHYSDTCKKNGGISEVIKEVEKVSPTLAAVVAIGNELRNEWQGYQSAEVSPEVSREMQRLSFLKEEWLKLDSKLSLERVIERIKDGSTDEAGDSNGDDSSERSPQDKGEGSQGTDAERESQDKGESGSEPSKDDSGVSEEGERTGDDPSGEGSQDTDAEGNSQDKGGSDNEPSKDNNGAAGGGEHIENNVGEKQEGYNTVEGTSRNSTRDDRQGQEGNESSVRRDNSTEEGGGQRAPGGEEGSNSSGEDSLSGESNPQAGYGFSEGVSKLEEMGFTKKPSEQAEVCAAPYAPGGDSNLYEAVITNNSSNAIIRHRIERTIGTFTLSKKMKKYLLAQKQVGYQYGMKRGKLCSKSMHRVATGGAEPPIFKQRLSSKIQQDAVIFILGDCSGSMRQANRYTMSAACQISMSEVLQSMRIPHMMMQFTTNGYRRLHYITRSFTESRLSREILLNRYSSNEINMGCNADGEAVMAAAHYLAKMPQKNKILIVLSDGEPAFKSNSHKYLKDVVREIEDSKVMSIMGIGINSYAVDRYYGNYKVVEELPQLEGVLLSILKDNIIK